MQTESSIDEAIRKCHECRHEVVNYYRKDDQGNITKLLKNCKPRVSESGVYLELIVTGNSCDVVSQKYRGILKDYIFNGCPFFEKK